MAHEYAHKKSAIIRAFYKGDKMKKTIKVINGKYTKIRCDSFKAGSLSKCDSVFNARSNSMARNISDARKLGWVIGKRDLCGECHRGEIPRP